MNNAYLEQGKLKVELFGRGMAWLDTGTHRAMLDAANFIEAVQTRQGLYVACLEEIAYRNGFIDNAAVEAGGPVPEDRIRTIPVSNCGNGKT